MIFYKHEGLQSHTHFKGIAMAPCKLPYAVFMRRSKDSLLNKLSNDLWYCKELTCHETTDPAVVLIDMHRPST